MPTIKWPYFIITVLLFVIEVLIAVFVDDNFIRPYFGDFLVVILMYTFIMSFLRARTMTVALAVLLFSYVIEILQYYKFVKLLGLQQSQLANVVLGNSFAWSDIVAYTLGILFVLSIEKIVTMKEQGQN